MNRPAATIGLAVFLVIFACGLPASADPIYYSFEADESGIGRLEVDPRTGRVLSHAIVYADAQIRKPSKLAMTDDGRDIALICSTDRGANLVIVTEKGVRPVRTLELSERPEAIQAFGHYFLIAGNDGLVWVVDARQGEIVGQCDVRKDMDPPGRQVEEIYILPGRKQALLSFQKDSRSGRYLGSRIALLDLRPEPVLRYDLPLPRNRPDLHYDPADNRREQGPNPEVMFVSPATNTVAVTLDLYGAVATFDLDAVLEQGQLKNLQYQPTSLDGTWGHAFPDRGVHFRAADREYVLVTNAGPAAGAVMLDLQKRRIIESYDTDIGLEYPIFLLNAQMLVAGPDGKRKQRGSTGLEKSRQPGRELYLWDVSNLKAAGGATLVRLPMDRFVYRTAAVSAEQSTMVVAVTGNEKPTELTVIDADTRQVIGDEPALGHVQRVLLSTTPPTP